MNKDFKINGEYAEMLFAAVKIDHPKAKLTGLGLEDQDGRKWLEATTEEGMPFLFTQNMAALSDESVPVLEYNFRY